MARLNFVELPSADSVRDSAFYEGAFSWSLTGFGPTYACTMTGDVDLGLQADTSEATAKPLAVIEVEDLDATRAAVIGAGGYVTRDVFAFPGGRRFHFTDPSGNELAAMVADH